MAAGRVPETQDRTDDHRPAGEKPERWPKNLSNPGVGGASIHVQTVQMAEGEDDTQHDKAAIKQTCRCEDADGGDQCCRAYGDAIGRPASGHAHDYRFKVGPGRSHEVLDLGPYGRAPYLSPLQHL